MLGIDSDFRLVLKSYLTIGVIGFLKLVGYVNFDITFLLRFELNR
jgi:hypothetical protein